MGNQEHHEQGSSGMPSTHPFADQPFAAPPPQPTVPRIRSHSFQLFLVRTLAHPPPPATGPQLYLRMQEKRTRFGFVFLLLLVPFFPRVHTNHHAYFAQRTKRKERSNTRTEARTPRDRVCCPCCVLFAGVLLLFPTSLSPFFVVAVPGGMQETKRTKQKGPKKGVPKRSTRLRKKSSSLGSVFICLLLGV